MEHWSAAITAATSRRQLSQAAAEHLRRWLTHPAYADQRPAVEALLASGDWAAVDDAFRAVLRFGTAGRRGPMGAGSNRVNDRTVAEGAAALAAVVRRHTREPTPLCVVAHDSRRHSAEFACLCAEVLTAAGLRVALFAGPRSTPQLAFTVLDRGAAAGIMITASHNPPTDNGFKAFWRHGGQVVPPIDGEIIEAVEALGESPLPRLPLEQAQVEWLGDEADEAYQTYVASQAVGAERRVRLAFSPLQGVGAGCVLPVLRRCGFDDLHVVAAEAEPSATFDALPGGIANPEVPSALGGLIARCREVDADAGLASDPDADRIGFVARDPAAEGGYRVFTGNEIAALVCWHTLEARRRAGTLDGRQVVLKSVVGTDLLDRLGEEYQVRVRGGMPIGFRWFGEAIDHLEREGGRPPAGLDWLGAGAGEELLLAADESHGLNRGGRVRDKDAASAALALAELTAELKAVGLTPSDQLARLHARYGCHAERVLSLRLDHPGHRATILAALRARPPRELAGLRVAAVEDRADPASPAAYRSPVTGEAAVDDFLIFRLAGAEPWGSVTVAVRPSGTEPKLKLYVLASGAPAAQALAERLPEALLAAARDAADDGLASGPGA